MASLGGDGGAAGYEGRREVQKRLEILRFGDAIQVGFEVEQIGCLM